MRRSILSAVLMLVFVVTVSIQPAATKQFTLWGKPLNLFGFASQSAQISLKGDEYFVEEGLQQALLTAFAEADYRPRSDMTLYVSGILTMDLIYDIKNDDRTWNAKLFSQSRSRMYMDDRDWQFLKECHVTWAPGTFLFRVGKQIVSWGEMDFFRIMDQINPTDDRRGFSDVEFETTIIPIWLLRAEWWPQLNLGFAEETGLQFVFNPNAEFIPNQRLNTGNDYGGIWSAGAEIANPLFDALGAGTPTMYVGHPDENQVVEPDSWDDDAFEYALRLSLMIKGTILTLNGFYGLENSPQLLFADPGFVTDPLLSQVAGEPVPALGTASDGTSIVYPIYTGYHPRQKSVGVTWTGDLPFLITSLGGVNPLLRVEVRYQFDKVYTDADQTRYIESDYLDTGLGIDWKIKINTLNPRAYFSVMPQFFYSRIMDKPDGIALNDTDDSLLPDTDYYTVTMVLSTSYFNGKLVPQVAGAYLFNNEAHLILASLSYQYSDHWFYTVEACFLGGEVPNVPLWFWRKNDYIAFKIKYNWG
jgi:Protein of unknown function (DUF1302)